MKITVEHYDTKITVESPVETIWEVREQLLKPMLLALGFHPDCVEEVFQDE